MYDASTGGSQVWYQINVIANARTVYDALVAADKAELDAILAGTRKHAGFKGKCNVVDGYLIPSADMEVSHRENMNGSETVAADATLRQPVYNWHMHTYTTGSGTCVVRLILSYPKANK